MKAYKGFDKDMKCRGYQFEEGKTYEEPEADLCKKGFHACEHPLDVFGYYPPAESRYAEVELEYVSDKTDDDTKRVGKRITIGAELNLHEIIEAAVKFVFSKVDWAKAEEKATGYQGAASATGYQGAASATGNRGAASATGDYGAASATGYQGAASATGYQGAASATGYQGAASATGNRGAASATGYQGAASATGDQGAASATGYESVAVALGLEGKAKGIVGGYLVIAEWKNIDNTWHRVDVRSVKVDGEEIKADTWYKLEDGKFHEA
jgi:hypothetical protein